eukprot:GILJ01011915.1.p1 GENE.GILJ01011915.1~~GILJ01011915.1.p1  ORF type:complete len:382 (-),score=76.19 GILJ01011915.1:72-1217(-)
MPLSVAASASLASNTSTSPSPSTPPSTPPSTAASTPPSAPPSVPAVDIHTAPSPNTFGSPTRPTESIFQILTNRIRELEINQSLFNRYLEDMNGRYRSAFEEVHKQLTVVAAEQSKYPSELLLAAQHTAKVHQRMEHELKMIRLQIDSALKSMDDRFTKELSQLRADLQAMEDVFGFSLQFAKDSFVWRLWWYVWGGLSWTQLVVLLYIIKKAVRAWTNMKHALAVQFQSVKVFFLQLGADSPADVSPAVRRGRLPKATLWFSNIKQRLGSSTVAPVSTVKDMQYGSRKEQALLAHSERLPKMQSIHQPVLQRCVSGDGLDAAISTPKQQKHSKRSRKKKTTQPNRKSSSLPPAPVVAVGNTPRPRGTVSFLPILPVHESM